MHYYKFNISAWALSTRHLSLEEEAVYFRLINHYYDTEAPIPLETQVVFRRLRLGSDSVIAERILDEFFIQTEKGFIHKKCEELLKEYRKTATKNRKNGSLGGRPSKNAALKETQSVTSGMPDGTHAEPSGNPNYKLETNNQELITNNQVKDKPKARFVPPTVGQVREYCLERRNGIDADKFVSHYQANGWVRGKTPIKDWKACVITWEKRNGPINTPGKPSQQGFLNRLKEREIRGEVIDGNS